MSIQPVIIIEAVCNGSVCIEHFRNKIYGILILSSYTIDPVHFSSDSADTDTATSIFRLMHCLKSLKILL